MSVVTQDLLDPCAPIFSNGSARKARLPRNGLVTVARITLPGIYGRGASGPEFVSTDARMVGVDVRFAVRLVVVDLGASLRAGEPRVSASQEAALRQEANTAMALHAAGDQAAFRRLYAVVSDRLFHYLQRRTRDATRAEDLMQQTLLHMHRARGSYDSNRGVFPWMYAIAHNLVVDAARRGAHETAWDPDGGTPTNEPACAEGAADEQLIGLQLEKQIAVVLTGLPERQRAAFELVRHEGLSYAEAAEALSVSVSAVTALLHRADTAVMAAFKGAGD